ncbi:MAG: hypothetical protein ABR920_13835 [Terriglobales bacterium]
MADKKCTRNHSTELVAALSRSARNSLRVILSCDAATRQLRDALGVGKTPAVAPTDYYRGLAQRGETSRLFKEVRPLHPANITEMT